jgi:hypothetical protein
MGLAERLYPGIATQSEEGVRIQREPLKVLPRALRRRLLEQAVGRVRDRSGGIEAVLDALESSSDDPSTKRFAIASGIEMILEKDHILVSRLRPADS